MPDTLSIMSINLRGINDFDNFMLKANYIIAQRPEVLLLQETKISKAKNFTWYKLRNMYHIFENRDLKSKQGLMIGIKKSLVPYEMICFKIISPHICMASFTLKDTIDIFNIHAPNMHRLRCFFFKKLQSELSKTSNDVIVGGDWNVTGLNWELKYNFMLKQFKLTDVAVELDKQHLPTRMDTASQNRLDRVILNVKSISSLDYKLSYMPGTDHLAVKIGLKLGVSSSSRQFKKTIPVLEDNDWSLIMGKSVEDMAARIVKLELHPIAKWQILKADSYNIIINYIINKERELQDDIQEKTMTLDNLLNTSLNRKRKMELIVQLEDQIRNVNKRNQMKLALKLKRKDIWLRERNSSIIIRKLKARKAKAHIYAIRNGKVIKSDMLMAKTYLKYLIWLASPDTVGGQLVTKSQNSRDINYRFWISKNFRKPAPEDIKNLENKFSSDELNAAIKMSSKVATPGPDACPGMLYNALTRIQRLILLDFANEVFHIEESFKQSFLRINQAIVIPIAKKCKTEHDIVELRPIALMNYEIKIFSKMCLYRLTKMVAEMLPNGMAGVKGRSIQRALFLHYVSMALARKSGLQTAFLMKLDVFKAFSTLNVDYLCGMLIKYCGWNFTTRTVINLVSIKEVAVKVNNYTTSMYEVKHSILQGSPLSSLLYGLYLKELVEIIGKAISGFHIRVIKEHITVVNYINDITVMISSCQEIQYVKRELDWFQKLTGTKINLKKSYIYDIIKGTCRRDIMFEGKPDKILGVDFHKIMRYGAKNVFGEVFDPILLKVGAWKQQWMNWFDRKEIINRLLISKWVYYLPFVIFLQKDKKVWANFVQKLMLGKFRIVCYERTITPILKGGLGVMDLILLGVTATYNFLTNCFQDACSLERFLQYNYDSGDRIIDYWIRVYRVMKDKATDGKCRYGNIHQIMHVTSSGNGLLYRSINLKFVEVLKVYQNLYNFWIKAQNVLLPTRVLLERRGMLRGGIALCVLCKQMQEDQEHLLNSCGGIQNFLKKHRRNLLNDKGRQVNFSLLNIMEFRRNRRLKVILIYYTIWKHRCDRVFRVDHLKDFNDILEDLLTKFIRLDCARLSESELAKRWETQDLELYK